MVSRSILNNWPIIPPGGTPAPVSGGGGAALGPLTASFASDSRAGTPVATITGLQPGETITSISPNDGRFLIAGGGTQIVVGMSLSSSGVVNLTLTSSSGRSLAMAVTVASVAPINQLRTVNVYNYVAGTNTALPAGQTELAGTAPIMIGSGDVGSVAVRADNGAISPSGSNAIALPGNTISILEMYVEYAGALTRLQFGGSNTRTLTDGEYDVVSDEISKIIPRGGFGLLHYKVSVPASTNKVPTWAVDQSRYHAAYSAYSYDPAVNTATIGVGGWTHTGTKTGMARHMCFLVLGKFSSGDPDTFLHPNDSTGAGTFDVSYGGALSPRATFMRALYGTGGTDALAGITCALSGGKPDPWYVTTNSAAMTSLVKYCSVVVNGFAGLNTFPTAGAANAFPTGETSTRSQWTTMWSRFKSFATAAAGAKPQRIIQWSGTPRISAASISGVSPDNVAIAVASQAPYGPQWDLGGDAQKLRDWIATQVGQAGGPDMLWNADSILRPTTDNTQSDYYKFKAGLNTDLVHFGYLLAPVTAVSQRTAMLSIQ